MCRPLSKENGKTRLRNFKARNKDLVLSDEKGLRGAGRLTDKVIDPLQGYYGGAIRGDQSALDGMRKAVWAIWYHKALTNAETQHEFCPLPPNTWCAFRKAEAEGTVDQYEHKVSIPRPIFYVIKPTFNDLSNPNLISLGGVNTVRRKM